MKVGLFITLLLLAFGMAKAGDVSCQADLLKPKFKAPVIEEEDHKPGSLTLAEARLRLQQSRQEIAAIDAAKTSPQTPTEEEEPTPEEDSEVTNKSAKKESRMGGLFDILLPSKLRNPVK
ncbi:hypothetical protein [Marinicella meishanensis]|uniref:hypothetical protein n=1 Tax=Marinicella meishanensis TaxID=2873263 RepID=UPI001CBCE8C8|nr:hypothetical protein [Marinicella sp. NBU2979]